MSKKELNISFEDSLKELEIIVTKLEKGELTLDESIDQFQKGVNIYKTCNNILAEAEGKVRLIVEDEEGNIDIKDFDKV